MSEMRLPEVPPPPSPPHWRRRSPEGPEAFTVGFAIAWAINVVGAIVLLIVGAHWVADYAIPMLGAAVPLTATAAVVLYAFWVGRWRLAVGILVGVASVWALILLLVAACFGLVSAVTN